MVTTTPVLDQSRPQGEETLTTLIYVSTAVELFSPERLLDLLQQARSNNTRLGISGMLLYKGGNFMQTLEGADHAVRKLYSVITLDPRHKGASKLIEYTGVERQFANWTMGFSNLDGAKPPDGVGYTDIFNLPLDSSLFRENPSRAQKLLSSFRKNM